jgi:hypothetical protein
MAKVAAFEEGSRTTIYPFLNMGRMTVIRIKQHMRHETLLEEIDGMSKAAVPTSSSS